MYSEVVCCISYIVVKLGRRQLTVSQWNTVFTENPFNVRQPYHRLIPAAVYLQTQCLGNWVLRCPHGAIATF